MIKRMSGDVNNLVLQPILLNWRHEKRFMSAYSAAIAHCPHQEC